MPKQSLVTLPGAATCRAMANALQPRQRRDVRAMEREEEVSRAGSCPVPLPALHPALLLPAALLPATGLHSYC